ncbi:hypothetical protein GO491_04375 [Flavobacteriaceae bacterium Ap0902]|nr:hypothetical protein [Flavobacteriaceae bacterium Ap0902]
MNYKLNYYQICGLFRIAVVSLAFIDLSSLLYDYKLFFSDKAILPIQLGLVDTEYFSLLNPIYNSLENNIGITNFFYITISLYFIILLMCIAGFYTRISFLIGILLQILIFRSITNFNYGYDQFITMSFFYCLIFPVGKEYSIDYNNKNYNSKTPNFFFSLNTFLKIHLCIVYFTSGLAKCSDPNWWNGNAIWRAMADLSTDFYINPYLLMALSIGTLLLEISYPIFAFSKFKILRRTLVISIILMHLGIGIFLGLSSFATVMIIWNITAFYKDFTHE